LLSRSSNSGSVLSAHHALAGTGSNCAERVAWKKNWAGLWAREMVGCGKAFQIPKNGQRGRTAAKTAAPCLRGQKSGRVEATHPRT
jgi:hypothetical protein